MLTCRHCAKELTHIFANLYHQPASNSFLTAEELKKPETYYPLQLYVCDECFLVQVDEYKDHDEIFNGEYVYFSSMSTSWLDHARRYVAMMQKRFALTASSFVVEIASNDGYLLQYVKEAGIACLGIEPSANTAAVARSKGIDCLEDFFNNSLAQRLCTEKGKADLVLGNNVLAHVPDINDFVQGLKILLKPNGVITMEFPHLMELVNNTQFDTIYQEHYSYLSLTTVSRIFSCYGLRIFDVEQIPTHGGSLRVFATHTENSAYVQSSAMQELLLKEKTAGMTTIAYYGSFQRQIEKTKNALLQFLLEQKAKGKSIAAYGAAAKGNTFLNLCGVKPDMIDFCVDKASSKQGKFMPGSHIPVFAPEKLEQEKPDFVLILPWNIKDEVMHEHRYVKNWGGRFAVAIPELILYP